MNKLFFFIIPVLPLQDDAAAESHRSAAHFAAGLEGEVGDEDDEEGGAEGEGKEAGAAAGRAAGGEPVTRDGKLEMELSKFQRWKDHLTTESGLALDDVEGFDELRSALKRPKVIYNVANRGQQSKLLYRGPKERGAVLKPPTIVISASKGGFTHNPPTTRAAGKKKNGRGRGVVGPGGGL